MPGERAPGALISTVSAPLSTNSTSTSSRDVNDCAAAAADSVNAELAATTAAIHASRRDDTLGSKIEQHRLVVRRTGHQIDIDTTHARG